MLRLGRPRTSGELWAYSWGGNGLELWLTEAGTGEENIFELDARKIILFKRHPVATSACNLLTCSVRGLFGVKNRIGVELDCGGNRLVAQIVPDAVRELRIEPARRSWRPSRPPPLDD